MDQTGPGEPRMRETRGGTKWTKGKGPQLRGPYLLEGRLLAVKDEGDAAVLVGYQFGEDLGLLADVDAVPVEVGAGFQNDVVVAVTVIVHDGTTALVDGVQPRRGLVLAEREELLNVDRVGVRLDELDHSHVVPPFVRLLYQEIPECQEVFLFHFILFHFYFTFSFHFISLAISFHFILLVDRDRGVSDPRGDLAEAVQNDVL
jgi:hypothetical protein